MRYEGYSVIFDILLLLFQFFKIFFDLIPNGIMNGNDLIKKKK